MAKIDNHLLLYSNVNVLDYIDINKNNIAKAWTILFHYRGKSIESMLYEQFNSIAQRNTISKTKNHEVFNELYLQLNSQSFQHGLKAQVAGACEETGWPIDIYLSEFNSFRNRNSAGASMPFKQQYAVYFLLQEEIGYNS